MNLVFIIHARIIIFNPSTIKLNFIIIGNIVYGFLFIRTHAFFYIDEWVFSNVVKGNGKLSSGHACVQSYMYGNPHCFYEIFGISSTDKLIRATLRLILILL